MRRTTADMMRWLHRLDTYTNAEFGNPRTLSAINDTCVACGHSTTRPDVEGLCEPCARRCVPEYSDIRFDRA